MKLMAWAVSTCLLSTIPCYSQEKSQTGIVKSTNCPSKASNVPEHERCNMRAANLDRMMQMAARQKSEEQRKKAPAQNTPTTSKPANAHHRSEQ